MRLLLFALVLFVSACSPSQFIKPLAKKEKAINASFGGPLISNLGPPIPIPFINTTLGYGIDSSTTLFGGLNLTSALFGNFQTQVGATKAFAVNKGAVPGISSTLALNYVARDFKTMNFYPQLDFNAWWDFGKNKQHYFYTGISNWFEPKSTRSHNEPQTTRLIFTPQAGVRFSKNTWQFFIETKLIGPNLSNKDIVVDYVSPIKNHGALGFYLGVNKTIK